MKRLALICFVLLSSAFADSYRLLDTPRCIVDYDASKNIVDASKCSMFHDQFLGDSTFSATMVCHDTKALDMEPNVFLYPASLSDDPRESYVEITERTHYSFKVEFAFKLANREPVIIAIDQFNEWLRSGRVDNCQFRLYSPKKVMKLGE